MAWIGSGSSNSFYFIFMVYNVARWTASELVDKLVATQSGISNKSKGKLQNTITENWQFYGLSAAAVAGVDVHVFCRRNRQMADVTGWCRGSKNEVDSLQWLMKWILLNTLSFDFGSCAPVFHSIKKHIWTGLWSICLQYWSCCKIDGSATVVLLFGHNWKDLYCISSDI